MNTAILISIILGTKLAAFTALMVYKQVRDVLAWREAALVAYKQIQMRQELVRFVGRHR